MADALHTFGGTSIVQSFVATAISLLGIGAAAYAISTVLRAHSEEEAGHVESILATSIGRFRWLFSHLVFVILGPTIAMLVVGFAAGISYGGAVSDLGGVLPGVLGGALGQLPAIWILAGIAVALFGGAPRWASAAWAVLAGCVLLGQVGAVIGMPQWILDISPFTHLPQLPGGPVHVTALVWSTVVAVAAILFGFASFHRRDLRG